MARIVVVGAGSAGSVVTRRLIDAGHSVTLVEAGPDVVGEAARGLTSPSFFDALAEPGRTWSDLTARRVAGQDERFYARGRGVGGSSAVNAMIGLWGETDDYDRWERDHGCVGWSWSDVQPVFMRMPVPLRTPRPAEIGPLGRAVAEIGRDDGWVEHVGPGAVGPLRRDVGRCRLTQHPDGRRASAFDVYVEAVRHRPELTIRVDTHVERIMFSGDRAVGVGLSDDSVIDADAVVVAAGAIETPRLLRRSGVDNEFIGRGLQDHAAATFTVLRRDAVDPSSLAVGVVGRFSSGRAPADLQILPIEHLGSGDESAGTAMLGVVNVALMNVHSRGRVDATSVNFDMLSDERDLDALVQGVSSIRDWFDRAPLRVAVDAVFVDDRGTHLDDLGVDERSLRQWVSAVTGDYVHAAGSCAMGRRGESVVDSCGRSWDRRGLWIADASIMPRIPRANTHLPTVMVAERVVEFLNDEIS
jgi:choline dehydrogenase/5-(hydroxymethyl)furfural/furfural oxidase